MSFFYSISHSSCSVERVEKRDSKCAAPSSRHLLRPHRRATHLALPIRHRLTLDQADELQADGLIFERREPASLLESDDTRRCCRCYPWTSVTSLSTPCQTTTSCFT